MSANIDLHTAPGSQNGFDNSGRTGQVGRSKLHIRLIAETLKDLLNDILSENSLLILCFK